MADKRVLLVVCVKGKQQGVWHARDLYQSPLFEGRRTYAERSGCSWFILSAKYGLVHPDQPIGWYEATLKGMTARERRQWSENVLIQIDRQMENLRGATVEIHAGKEYRNFGLTYGLESRGANVEAPTGHLELGQQLAWYQHQGPADTVTPEIGGGPR